MEKLTSRQLAEVAQALAEFQEALEEARITVTRLIGPVCSAAPGTQKGAVAHFTILPELGRLSNDELLGVAMSATLALVQLHRNPKLKVVDIYPLIVDKNPRA